MTSSPNSYQVYIIRAWREESISSGQTIVRFVLEIPEKEFRKGFIDSTALVKAIEKELVKIEEITDDAP